MTGTNLLNTWLSDRAAYEGVVMQAFVCPSSEIEVFKTGVGLSGGTEDSVQSNHFVGLAGAVDDSANGFVETRNRSGGELGVISGGGMLLLQQELSFGDASDGLSNVALIGEVSDYLLDAGVKEAPNSSQSFPMSTRGGGNYSGSTVTSLEVIDGNNSADYTREVFTLTTIRYPLNFGNGGFDGVGNGKFNNGLHSPHPGGVNVVYGDASVHFLNDSIELLQLRRLVTRDDGASLSGF